MLVLFGDMGAEAPIFPPAFYASASNQATPRASDKSLYQGALVRSPRQNFYVA